MASPSDDVSRYWGGSSTGQNAWRAYDTKITAHLTGRRFVSAILATRQFVAPLFTGENHDRNYCHERETLEAVIAARTQSGGHR